MLRISVFAGLLALCVAAGCRAQSSPVSDDAALNRRIEVLVRSQYNIPQDFDVTLGARTSSQLPGYQTLPITIAHGGKQSTIDFLISNDNKTLAKLDTFDLARDPASDIDISGRPIRGNPNAKVTVINFDDLECPYCARMHQTLFPSTMDHYKGLVRFIYKDDPLVEIHPWAMHAAVDANCLAAQNGQVYWTYVDYLHSHGDEITGPDRDLTKSFLALDRVARQEATLGKLDQDKLNTCIANQDESKIKASAALADSLGVDGTPALFINGERVMGLVPEPQLWMVIDRALRAAGIQPPPQTDAAAPSPAR